MEKSKHETAHFYWVYLSHLVKGIVLFAGVYGFANWVSSFRSDHFHLYMEWEKNIPLIPSFIWIYASLGLMLFVPMFFITRSELTHLFKAFTFSIFVAGVIFLVFPGQMGYDRMLSLEAEHAGAFEVLFQWDHPHNLYPSLHITIGFLLTRLTWVHLNTWGKLILGIWYILMSASVLLIHQHHVFDILSGLILGKLAFHRFAPSPIQVPPKIVTANSVYESRWQTSQQ